MSNNDLAIVVLAAGKGTRMRSAIPKVMHHIGGRPMIVHLLETCATLSPDHTLVVIGPNDEIVHNAVKPTNVAIQPEQRGTADAVLAARKSLEGVTGTILILFGADPLIAPDTLRRMVELREMGTPVVLLGFRADDPAQYGRILLDKNGNVDSIIEHWEATDAERAVNLCNGGAMAIDSNILWSLIEKIGNDNSKGEYYLTELVSLARENSLECKVVEATAVELVGIDTRADLALAECELQRQLRVAALDLGVTLVDPDTVWFSYDTKLAPDSVVEPNVVFGLGVSVAPGAIIRSFSHIEQASIGNGATVGPFARIRPGTVIQEHAHVGNFVEIKNSEVGSGTKVNHLSYVGDARLGSNTNVGAGTITANYDGFRKSHTTVGAGASIGSNSVLVAPVNIGDGAVIGAGSVVRDDVPEDALFVKGNRQDSRLIKKWAYDRREREEKGDT